MNKLKRKVPIENVIYMFSYIWDKVEYTKNIFLDGNDDFDSINVLAKLYLENIKSVISKGIYKEYNEIKEELRGIKGKVDFKDSLNQLSLQNAKSVCIFDELNEDNIINQIIKTTAYRLYKSEKIDDKYKNKLNNILLYFNKVRIIRIDDKIFKNLKFNRNNYYAYYMIKICELICSSLMLSEESGKFKFIDILDDNRKMQQVFELFVCSYYKKRFKNNYKVTYQKKLNWNMLGGKQEIVPEMRVDIYLENKEEAVMIDTKYYPNFLKKSYYSDDKRVLISGNLYQMFTYMNHLNSDKKIRGMLLYPFNGEDISEKYEIDIMNNFKVNKAIIQIQTIDLSKKWKEIEYQLDSIIKDI